MESMFAHFASFVGAVFGHVFTLLAGCVVTVMINLIEKYLLKGKRMPIWADVSVLLLFLFFACFQAWNNQRATADTQSSLAKISNDNFEACDKDRFGKTVLTDQLLSQISQSQKLLDGQQGTFNQCVLALGVKKNEPLRISAIWVYTGLPVSDDRKRFLATIISETNQLLTSVNLRVHCDHDFMLQRANFPHEGTTVFGGEQLDNQSADVQIGAPWAPGQPLVTTVTFDLSSLEGKPYPYCTAEIPQPGKNHALK